MDSRELEASLLARCAAAARTTADAARDKREANVFRLASMVVRSRFPDEASHLMTASDRYFRVYPSEKLGPEEVVRAGWVASLPRLRDMLTLQLRRSA
jgi:hypothetical protein